MPQHLCAECESAIEIFYKKIEKFQLLEKQWLTELRIKDAAHPCLDLREKVNVSC